MVTGISSSLTSAYDDDNRAKDNVQIKDNDSYQNENIEIIRVYFVLIIV
jgi:hypothetical protein